jgi:HlyD family secretion protein
MPDHFSGCHRHLRATLAAAASGVLILLAACEPVPTMPQSKGIAQQSSPAAVASARGRVDIEGGVIRLAARRDGVIADVLVEEGARVRQGQLLAMLDDLTARSTLQLAESEVRQAAQLGDRAALELQTAERELKRLQPLADRESVARQELDRARDAHALAALSVAQAHAALATARAREAVAAREVEERRIVAPRDGQIIQRKARPGNGVSTLNVTPLFLFVPDVPRIVRAELEEQVLGKVTLNQSVELVLEADPARVLRGSVLRIGHMVGARTPSDDPAERQDNRVVEVVIRLDDGQSLLIGQRVIARFLAAAS